MTRAVPVLALALLLPASTHAQATDAPTPSLPVNPGEKIIVTRVAGDGTLRGRLVGIVDGSVVLDDGPTRHVVPMDDVDRVERPKDRIWNGALIGYGIGFAAGAVMVLSDSCRPQPDGFFNLCFDGPEFAMAVGAVITGPIGMAAGAIGDAIRRKPRVVFDRASRGGVALVVYPAFVRGGAGLRMAMTF